MAPKKQSRPSLFSKIKDFCEKHKEPIKYLYQFTFMVIVYGLLLNFTLSTLFSFEFKIINVGTLGVAFYFIKEELPRIISKCFPIQKKQ